MINNHPAKFGSHKHSSRRDIMIFVCHLALRGHVIRAFITL